MAIMNLETARLILRPFETADAVAVQSYAKDRRTTRYMKWGPNSPRQTLFFLNRAQATARETPRLEFDSAIILRETNELIGGCGIYIRSVDHKEAELGYCLRRDMWGQGIIPEAATRLLEFGFGELCLHRIFARCHVKNTASARVMEKIGMQYEGVMRGSRFIKGAWWDFKLYAVLESDR